MNYYEKLNVLNKLSERMLRGNLIDKYEPILFTGKDESITIVLDDMGPFDLNTVVSGTLVKPNSDHGNNTKRAVSRKIVSYPQVDKWLNNELTFNYDMSLIINSVLLTLTKHLGDLKNRKITCELPGKSNEFFFSSDNYAGFELRFYVE